MMWRSSNTAELYFDDVRVPKENIMGNRGDGFHQMLKTLDGGRLSIAAMGLGGAQGAFDLASSVAAAGGDTLDFCSAAADYLNALDAQSSLYEFNIILKRDRVGQLADTAHSGLPAGIDERVDVVRDFLVWMRDLHGSHNIAQRIFGNQDLKPELGFLVELADGSGERRCLFQRFSLWPPQ